MWILIGLGNPDAQYDGTRHSVGRNFLEHIAKRHSLSDWKKEGKKRAVVAKSELFGQKVVLVLPETYMNDSGLAARNYISSAKAAEKLVVFHDDLDLPLGKVKISFGSGAGGHKGVESIQKNLKTKDFIRIRIGISPTTSSGKMKKPDAEKIIDFVLGKFKAAEQEKLKKSRKTAEDGLELLLTDGISRAMTEINAR